MQADPAPILVVDDLQDSRELYRVWLQLLGYRVEVASDGAQAWTLLQQRPFCAVLTDMWMPHLNGAELIALMRADDRTARIPIILCTASSEIDARSAPAADAFLRKPFALDALEGLLQQHHCPR